MFDAPAYGSAERATRQEPSALNWGRFAWACLQEDDKVKEAREAIAKALELDPTSSDAKSISFYAEAWDCDDDNEAVKCFMSAISLKRDVSAFHYGLADCLDRLGEFGFALAELAIALQLQSDYEEAKTLKDEVFEKLRPLFASDKPEDLLQVQSLALSTLHPEPQILLKIADECVKQNRAQYALYYLKWACDIEPSNAESWHVYAQTLFELGRKSEAIEASEKARNEALRQKVSTSHIEATYFAQVGLTSEDSDEAIKHLTLAVEAEPNCPKWQTLLGEAYLKAEKFEELINCIDKHSIGAMQEFKDIALERLKSIQHSESISEANAALEVGHWRTAVLKFSEAIRLQESPAEVYLGRSRAYARGRKFDQALADVAEAAEKDPENDEILFQQAQIHQWLKESNRAYKILRKLILSQPDNKQFRAAYRNLLGTLSSGQEALEHFTAAIEADPTVAIYYCNRATLYNAMSKYFLALEDVHAAMKIEEFCPEALDQESIALQGLKFPDSEETQTDIVKEVPTEDSRMTTSTSLML